MWQTEPNHSDEEMGYWATDWGRGFLLGKQLIPGAKLFARRKPTIAQNADGRLESFAVGLDGHLYHIWQTTKNNSSEWSELTPLGSGTLPK